MSSTYAGHVSIRAAASEVFAYIDDIRNVAAHMSAHRSAAMFGSRLAVQVVTPEATEICAVYRYVGRILGLSIDFQERVTRYEPPHLKEWATIGEPRMLILDAYVMTFTVMPLAAKETRLVIALAYTLPKAPPWRWIGRALALSYARWGVDAILSGSKQQLEARTAAPV